MARPARARYPCGERNDRGTEMGVWHIMPDHELGGGGVMIARLLQAFA